MEKEAVKVDNTYLKDAVTVKLPVPSGYAGKAGDTIYVKHSSEGYDDDYFAVEVKSEGGKLYVEFEVEHFSTFELMVDGVYAIVFDANGGEGGKTVYIPENGTITAPEVTRSGYVFAGWTPAVPETATESATYTATWSPIIYYIPTTQTTDGDIDIGDEEVPLSELPLLFVDVADGDWFREAVAYVFSKDLMVGVTDTQFSPYADSTRGMVALILMRLANGEAVEDALSFNDVASSDWFAEAAAWAAENGVFLGYDDGSFRGGVAITREQLAAVLYRYAQLKELDVSDAAELSAFVDADSVSEYAAPAMRWAVAAGLFIGDSASKLNPLSHATRAELATVLMRFCETVVAETASASGVETL